MNIDIICVGKIKERYFSDAISEYTKRLGRFAKISVTEVPDEKTPHGASEKTCEKIKEIEGDKILSKLKPGFTISMCIEGKQLSSTEIAEKLSDIMNSSSQLNLIIGGSLGLSEKVKKASDMRLSFGKITLPHQLMRVVLCEQVYRAFKILSNETYHK